LRGYHASQFNFLDVFGKGARGRIQQGTAANRINGKLYSFGGFASGTTGLFAKFAQLFPLRFIEIEQLTSGRRLT